MRAACVKSAKRQRDRLQCVRSTTTVLMDRGDVYMYDEKHGTQGKRLSSESLEELLGLRDVDERDLISHVRQCIQQRERKDLGFTPGRGAQVLSSSGVATMAQVRLQGTKVSMGLLSGVAMGRAQL